MKTKEAFDIVLDAATVFAVENEARSFHRFSKNSPEEVTGKELQEAIANVETYLDTYWGNNENSEQNEWAKREIGALWVNEKEEN